MIREDHLPVWAIVPEVNRLLATESALVVTAPPGAGKSTVLPLTMLEAFPEGKILMLEPRRIAARQIAGRMAALLGEEVGETVGYRIRFEKRVSRRTRIEVLTEGVLTRILIDDPSLEGVLAVLFDEFHERSLQTDLALALCRESQAVLRPDLKLVLLSATIDAEGLCRTLGAKHIDCPGKMFPVKIIHTGDIPPAQIEDAVVQTIRMAHRTEEGDILAFLPGEGEIRRVAENVAIAYGCTAELAFDTFCETLYCDPDTTAIGLKSASKVVGDENAVHCGPQMVGEDFAFYADQVKSVFFNLGARVKDDSRVCSLHSDRVLFDENCIEIGAAVLAQTAVDLLDALTVL